MEFQERLLTFIIPPLNRRHLLSKTTFCRKIGPVDKPYNFYSDISYKKGEQYTITLSSNEVPSTKIYLFLMDHNFVRHLRSCTHTHFHLRARDRFIQAEKQYCIRIRFQGELYCAISTNKSLYIQKIETTIIILKNWTRQYIIFRPSPHANTIYNLYITPNYLHKLFCCNFFFFGTTTSVWVYRWASSALAAPLLKFLTNLHSYCRQNA